ncbi:MAG: hypothetical protein K9G58_06340 [Bacteroidales bacterium]|nr:hypothetical protein [Bacteroidales bacterium]MCF8386554.1 hypothetical protein [Bacteroidales bacterium]MCF8397767.1 hypothetical protein [Bacteroidales bacterium]
MALGELNVKPQAVLFIDDLEHNLRAAERLGIVAVKMDRYKRHKFRSKYPVIASLRDLTVNG